MIVIESIGRKPKDAIDNGLAQLGKSYAEVEVEIIDHGGLFRKAKVRITAQEDEPIEVPTPVVEKPRAVEKIEKREEPAREIKREETREERREECREGHERREERRYNRERRERRVEAPRERKFEERAPREQKQEEQPHREPRRFEPITPELAQKAESFVTELVAKMGIEANIDTAVEEGELRISLTTEGSTAIGYHGEVLDSIEYMTSYVINRDSEKYYHVSVDCNNYRAKRKESLVALANKMAAKCLKVRHKIVLEPMNSNERKIIHSALADNDQIITRSEGHEPNRHIVILCKKRY